MCIANIVEFWEAMPRGKCCLPRGNGFPWNDEERGPFLRPRHLIVTREFDLPPQVFCFSYGPQSLIRIYTIDLDT